MHGLPASFDPGVFVGRTVESVCYSENSIHIGFDGRSSVTIEGSYSFDPTGDLGLERSSVPVEVSNLMKLTGKRVEVARTEFGRDLVLTFTEGPVLVCHDDSSAYECYHVMVDGSEFHV